MDGAILIRAPQKCKKAAEMVKNPGIKFVIINYHCKFPDIWSQYPLASG
jgi:arsenate reductase-like glutaredoxin family protein